MTRDQNSGIPTADELQKEEQELAELARKGEENEPTPLEDDDDEPTPAKKKEVKDDEENEDEDEDDGDIDDEDISEEDKEDDDEEEREPEDKNKIPAWKVKMQEKRERQRVETAVAEATANLRKEFEEKYGRKMTKSEEALHDESVDSLLEQLAEETDEKKKVLLMLKFFQENSVSTQMKEKMSKLDERTTIQIEEEEFNKDFKSQKKLLDKLFPDLNEKQLEKVKSKVKEIAYTEKYQNYSLSDIIRLNRKQIAPIEKRKTGEPSRGGTGASRISSDQLDIDKIDWDSLSIEEAERVMKQIEEKEKGKSRVKVFRRGTRINN